MNNISIYCLTLNPSHEDIIRKLSYIPVGLGSETFSDNCLTDKNGVNISNKNSFYGEYTFHYWIWKNYLQNLDTEWVGFCQYRKFFAKEELEKPDISFEDFKKIIVRNIDDNLKKYDCVLGSKFSVQNYKFSKIIKKHLKEFLMRPQLLFNKKKRSLKFHFDLFHGNGNLDLAVNQLDEENRLDFKNFMYNNTEFNPHNMFICRANLLKNYYNIVFPWLEKCEKIFGFNNLKSYGEKRIYGFLAERFLSYWFSKNYNVLELPIIGKDLSDYKNL
tara:strand:+ start:7331 stop:8152 length:822 start_codon:yes stop_codon:yes gene_type:complete